MRYVSLNESIGLEKTGRCFLYGTIMKVTVMSSYLMGVLTFTALEMMKVDDTLIAV